MSRAAEVPQGWTLVEALERTADLELWKAWITAKNAWEKGRVPAPSSSSAFLNKSPQEIQSLRKAADDTFQQIKDGLWRHLTDERLAAIGSRGSGGDAARTASERRWTNDLHEQFASLPRTYGEIIQAIDPVMQAAATEAEMRNRGAGLAHILNQLRIPR